MNSSIRCCRSAADSPGPFASDRRVAAHRETQPDTRADERQTIAETQRQAEREKLDRAARDELAVERDGGEPAGNRSGLDPDIVDQAARGAARAGEDVRAEVEPVRAAALRTDAAAEPFAGLEHDHVAIAQVPGGGEPGDSAANDDHVAVARHGRSRVTTTSSPSTRTAYRRTLSLSSTSERPVAMSNSHLCHGQRTMLLGRPSTSPSAPASTGVAILPAHSGAPRCGQRSASACNVPRRGRAPPDAR